MAVPKTNTVIKIPTQLSLPEDAVSAATTAGSMAGSLNPPACAAVTNAAIATASKIVFIPSPRHFSFIVKVKMPAGEAVNEGCAVIHKKSASDAATLVIAEQIRNLTAK